MKLDSHFSLYFLVLEIACVSVPAMLLAQATEPETQDSRAQNSIAQTSGQSQHDTIWYGPSPVRRRDSWEPPEVAKLKGRILEFDAQTLIYTDLGGLRHELESDRVEGVEVRWNNEEARSAHRLFRQGKYREAVTAIDRATKSGIPQWQQRILIAELIESADAIGNPKSAGGLFINLSAASPPAMLFVAMPLCWTTREPDEKLRREAVVWLENPSEIPGLLGASWMLMGSLSEKAKQRLTQLQRSKSTSVAQLATAQLWRLTPPPETKSNLKKWFDYRDSMLQPLRIGPTEFLADRLSRVSMKDLACSEWTRIATLHGERYHRATLALKSAQQCLLSENQTEEATRLAAWIDQLSTVPPSQ